MAHAWPQLDQPGLAGWLSPDQCGQFPDLDLDARHSIGLVGPWTPELVMRVHEVGARTVASFIHELGAAGPFDRADMALFLDAGIEGVRRLLHEQGIFAGATPSDIVSAVRPER